MFFLSWVEVNVLEDEVLRNGMPLGESIGSCFRIPCKKCGEESGAG